MQRCLTRRPVFRQVLLSVKMDYASRAGFPWRMIRGWISSAAASAATTSPRKRVRSPAGYRDATRHSRLATQPASRGTLITLAGSVFKLSWAILSTFFPEREPQKVDTSCCSAFKMLTINSPVRTIRS